MLLLLALAAAMAAATGDGACNLYTQQYWRDAAQWPDSVQDARMCGTRWHELMRLETHQMTSEADALWLLGFHQLCQAQLNVLALPARARAWQINASLLFVGDAMERQCGALADWLAYYGAADGLYREHLARLAVFNRYITAEAACDADNVTRFAFTGAAAALFVTSGERDPVDGALVARQYRVTGVLFLACLFAYCVALPLAALAILMLRRRDRQYVFYARDTDAATGARPVGQSESEIEMADMDGDLSASDEDTFARVKEAETKKTI